MASWCEFETSSYTSGSVTACESEQGDLITELMEDIFQAMDRLERRDKGKRREDGHTISV